MREEGGGYPRKIQPLRCTNVKYFIFAHEDLFLKFNKNFILKCIFKDLYVQPEYRSRGVGTKVHLCTSYTIVYEY